MDTELRAQGSGLRAQGSGSGLRVQDYRLSVADAL